VQLVDRPLKRSVGLLKIGVTGEDMTEEKKLTVEDCQEISDLVIQNSDAIIESARNSSDPMMDGASALLGWVYSEIIRRLQLRNVFRKPFEGAKSHADSYDFWIRETIQNRSVDPTGCFRCLENLNPIVSKAKGK
jgi:hypothetical protein